MIITGITPRDDNLEVMPVINRANMQIAALADGKAIRYINIHEQLAFPDGHLREGMANDGLHLTPKAYQVWADALKPLFTEILGPPASSTARRRPPATPAPRKVRDHCGPTAQDKAEGEFSEVSGVHARVRDRVSRKGVRHATGLGAFYRVSSRAAKSSPRWEFPPPCTWRCC